ncbi:hypothetical protein NA78x_002510 [Anatilimnocola sp. NA78]|uniref:hypothetical protein n=1 Tax=Anatilimnocola sp. NA78 TaxID=3415683 RepID=UPI003CE4A1BA
MTSPLSFLPFAKTAAEVGAGVVNRITQSAADLSGQFAKMLATDDEEEDAKKIEDGVKQPGNADGMLALIDQLQSGLQAKLQSMGLQLDGELTLSIAADGKVSVSGDSDAAAVLEQIINSDPKLQAKMGALKRAAEAAGKSDQAETKLKYFAGQLQLEAQEPVLGEEAISGELATIS